MLQRQRRMDESICEIINGPFYGNLLQTKILPRPKLTLEPCPGRSAALLRVDQSNGSKVSKTRSGSRLNAKNAEVVCALVEQYVTTHEFSTVGVMAPYRAQVDEIRRRLTALPLTRAQHERILIGTIHAFQGSERDVIIWDLVDTYNDGLGLLYKQGQGERLCNVAASRAKSKLVVVGDEKAFQKDHSLTSPKLRQVLSSIASTVRDLPDLAAYLNQPELVSFQTNQ